MKAGVPFSTLCLWDQVRSVHLCKLRQLGPISREYTGRVLNGVGRGGRLGIAGVWYLWATWHGGWGDTWMYWSVRDYGGEWFLFGRVRGISPATCIYIQYSWFFDTLHPISTAVVQQKHQVDLLRLPGAFGTEWSILAAKEWCWWRPWTALQEVQAFVFGRPGGVKKLDIQDGWKHICFWWRTHATCEYFMYYCDQPEATCKAPQSEALKQLQALLHVHLYPNSCLNLPVGCARLFNLVPQLQMLLDPLLHPGPPRVVWHATSWRGSAPATTRLNYQHRLQMPGTAGGPGWLGGSYFMAGLKKFVAGLERQAVK